jgi:hypothetical protein
MIVDQYQAKNFRFSPEISRPDGVRRFLIWFAHNISVLDRAPLNKGSPHSPGFDEIQASRDL